MKNIGIFGATGSYDFGDYAMMIHNIEFLNKKQADFHFIIFTLSKEVTEQNLKENVLDKKLFDRIEIVEDYLIDTFSARTVLQRLWNKIYRTLTKIDFYYNRIYKDSKHAKDRRIDIKFLDALKKLDVLIFNGGGYLQHSWHFHNIRFMTEIRLGKKYGKKVFFLGNSVGPMLFYDKYTRETLPLVDGIMVRDGKNFSWQLLEEYGVQNKRMGPDDLFFVNDFYQEKIRRKQYVIIEIMSWLGRSKRGESYVIDSIVAFIAYMVREHKKDILLINFDIKDKKAEIYIDKIIKQSDYADHIDCCKEIEDMYEIFEYYRDCFFSLSFKYHPLILALGGGRPCAGIITDDDGYYESKMYGAFQTCNISGNENIIRLDEVSDKRLIQLYNTSKNIVCTEETKRLLWDKREEYINEIIEQFNK